jgi:creatinine amidohydrolase
MARMRHLLAPLALLALALPSCITIYDSDFMRQIMEHRELKGCLLSGMTWIEAREKLTPEAIVVIPLGAEAKEHGPHLQLSNDAQLATYFMLRVLEAQDVVVAPSVNYSYYPAFVEYPGSTHLRLETARDMLVDIVHSLAHHGPKRFYVLNTGVSTVKPLAAAQELLAAEGITLAFTDILAAGKAACDEVEQQPEGTHADEIETSMMLYIGMGTVDMSKATKDFPHGKGPMTPDPAKGERVSPSGIYGDATLATREKGEKVVECVVKSILADIEKLRASPLPAGVGNPGGLESQPTAR